MKTFQPKTIMLIGIIALILKPNLILSQVSEKAYNNYRKAETYCWNDESRVKIRDNNLPATNMLAQENYRKTRMQNKKRAMERVEQLKKIKLLDMLNLDSDNSEKFLIKYNEYEKKLKELRDKMDKLTELLKVNLRHETEDKELDDQTKQMIELRNQMHNLMNEKTEELRKILNSVQFAKFMIFESTFANELRQRLFDLQHRRGEGRGNMRRDRMQPPPDMPDSPPDGPPDDIFEE